MPHIDAIEREVQACGDPHQALQVIRGHLQETRLALALTGQMLASEIDSTKQILTRLEEMRNEVAGQMRDSGTSVTEIARTIGLTDSGTSKAIAKTGRPPLLTRNK